MKWNNYLSKAKVSEVIFFFAKIAECSYLVLLYNTCTYVIHSYMLHRMFSD